MGPPFEAAQSGYCLRSVSHLFCGNRLDSFPSAPEEPQEAAHIWALGALKSGKSRKKNSKLTDWKRRRGVRGVTHKRGRRSGTSGPRHSPEIDPACRGVDVRNRVERPAYLIRRESRVVIETKCSHLLAAGPQRGWIRHPIESCRQDEGAEQPDRENSPS